MSSAESTQLYLRFPSIFLQGLIIQMTNLLYKIAFDHISKYITFYTLDSFEKVAIMGCNMGVGVGLFMEETQKLKKNNPNGIPFHFSVHSILTFVDLDKLKSQIQISLSTKLVNTSTFNQVIISVFHQSLFNHFPTYYIFHLDIMKRDQNYDYLAKLLIIGDSGVGKTNILLRFCENNFMTSHLTTIGIDFKIKTIEIDGKKIRLQIWDTAGQQRFKTITQTYYKGAMGIIMVYAINDRASFNALQNWMRQIKTHASQNVVKVLIGNKSDCADRQVSFEEGKKMADSFGVQFFEVSAKNNSNISQTFIYMAKQIKDKVLTGDESVFTKQYPKGAKITEQKTKQSAKSGCC